MDHRPAHPSHRSVRDAIVRPRRTTSLVTLLVVLGALQFGYPITYQGQLWAGAYIAAYAAMIWFGIQVLRSDDDRVGFAVAFAVFLVPAAAWFAFDPNHSVSRTVMLVGVGAFQLVLLTSLVRYIISRRPGTTTLDLLLAAVSAYLLLGGVFGVVFSLVETASPGSFVDNGAPDRPLIWQSLLYHSFVTLSTLGYGDIVPVGAWARSLVTLETVSGTLFIAIVIANLVGLVSGAAPDAEAGVADDPSP